MSLFREEGMSKRSTATVRDTPLEAVATATAAGVTVHAETLVVDTHERLEIVDLTDRVRALVARVGVREGLVNLWPMHTTCTLLVNEYQVALVADMRQFLETLVSRDAAWQHNDPDRSDCDRMNADAHLRALLVGHGLTLQVSGGDLVLGQWQRVLLADFDGPRARTLRLQVWGLD